MDDDQNQAPILDAIRAYRESNPVPFTTPGHKLGRGTDDEMRGVLGEATFAGDIPELGGMDDRHMSKGVLTKAEDLAAKAFGSDQTMFSVNGSSLSAHTMLLTVASAGEKVIVARNLHKSGVAALVMAGVEPIWLHPPVDEELN